MDLAKLHQILDSHFDLEDLRTVAFYADVNFDHLGGEGSSAKARELILYVNNRNKLDDLLAAIRRLRPGMPLDDMLQPSEPEPPSPADEPAEIEARYGRTVTDIRRALRRGRLVFFVGADLDQSVGGVPSRRTIADSLAAAEGLERGQSLAAVAQQVMRYGNRFAFTNHLRDLLDTAGKKPQPFHTYLAGLVQENQLETIITTAYADLLEAAFRQAGLGLNVVVNDDDLRFANPDQPTLLKLYGDWRQPASLIVTEQDENGLIRGRIQDKGDILDEVTRAFRRNTILFLGYDLSDTAVAALFDEVAGDQFQQPAYAVWSGLPAPVAASFQSNRALTVIDGDPVQFLRTLLNHG